MTDNRIASQFDCGPEGLPLVTRRRVAGEEGVIELKYVECLVAAVHTCFVAEPRCTVVDYCIDHEESECDECDRKSGWTFGMKHVSERDTYYILDSAHGYNPNFKR